MFSVQCSGFRVQGSGFRVQGSGFRVQGSGFRVQGSGFRKTVRPNAKAEPSHPGDDLSDFVPREYLGAYYLEMDYTEGYGEIVYDFLLDS